MTDNVVRFSGVTRLDMDPQQVLDMAKEDIGEEVVVIGYNKDGEFYFASSAADGGDVLWLLEMAQMKLLMIGSE